MDIFFEIQCYREGTRSQKFRLVFPYNASIVDTIKTIPKEARTFDMGSKCWILTDVALYQLMVSFAKTKGIRFVFPNPEDREFFKKRAQICLDKDLARRKMADLRQYWLDYKKECEENADKYHDKVHHNLKEGIKLYTHQVSTAMFINEVRNALISHDMGTGKTLSSIAFVELNESFDKVFVITPNSLKFNYYYEVEKFTNSKAHIIGWKKNKYSLNDAKYIITNYEYFQRGSKKDIFAKLKKIGITKINALICDECHRLKNTKSNTYVNFKNVFRDDIFIDSKPCKIFMSGTPMPNRAHELYTVLNQISPLDFPSKTKFMKDYCGTSFNVISREMETNMTNTMLENLYYKIEPYSHRRKKSDVLDLPEKITQKVNLVLSDEDQSIYDKLENGVANDFIQENLSNPLTIMLRLRQFTSDRKIESASEIIDAALNSDEKIVVFDEFCEPLKKLKEKYGSIACLHTGDATVDERANMVSEFQDDNGRYKIFLVNYKTGNYGLTLTKARQLIMLTPPYTWGEFDQGSSRIHRISQMATCYVYVLTYVSTVDEYVMDALESKIAEISKVLDNEDHKSDIDDTIVRDIVKKIKKKHNI